MSEKAEHAGISEWIDLLSRRASGLSVMCFMSSARKKLPFWVDLGCVEVKKMANLLNWIVVATQN